MRRRFQSIAAAALLVALAACSAQAGTAASTDPTASPAASTAASAAASDAVAVVSANTATHDELVAALTAAGVVNADRWASEVEEYRPYDTSDPTLQHLQDELAKYNPDAATLAAILSVLEP